MTVLHVIFSHGQESGPIGTKIDRLTRVARARGARVDSLDYRPDKTPEERSLAVLCERFDAQLARLGL